MCGFVTWLSGDQSVPEDLAESAAGLSHRGPDDSGEWFHSSGRIGFAHRRLSIIDLEQGHQPIVRGGSSIVYNGELYNYRSLRRQLKEAGYDFTTDSDTEVFLQGYRCWGPEVFDRARGMFALAIWDEPGEQLVLARDHLGQKPLFYYREDETLIAASELQILLKRSEVKNRLNLPALAGYLRLGYINAPQSAVQDIYKLQPGNYLVAGTGGEIELNSYWSPADVYFNSEKQADASPGLIRERLSTAVERRMISDVPLGAFLSGGIDSSIIVGLMQSLSSDPVKTVSVGFEADRFDERDYARQVAQFNGTDHHEYTVDMDLSSLLPQLVRHFGEPFADSSAVPTYYVAQQTRQVVKVALSGDGGDELFGGYRRYRAMQLFSTLDSYAPGWLREFVQSLARRFGLPADRRSKIGEVIRLLQQFAEDERHRYLSMVGLGSETWLSELVTGEFAGLFRSAEKSGPLARELSRLAPAGEQAEKMMLADLLSYLPGDLLVKTDITTMMNSLECRCPFLDRDVIELALAISADQKIRGSNQKVCLRDAFKDLLPDPIANRGKMGFGVPLATWFREGEESAYLRDVLLSPQAGFEALFDRSQVEKLHNLHNQSKIDAAPLLWALTVLKLWLNKFDLTLP